MNKWQKEWLLYSSEKKATIDGYCRSAVDFYKTLSKINNAAA